MIITWSGRTYWLSVESLITQRSLFRSCEGTQVRGRIIITQSKPCFHSVVIIVTVDESICEIERSEDEEESEDDKSDICQLLKPMDGVSAQRQVLRALALEV